MKKIAVFGSTGSIGTQTLSVAGNSCEQKRRAGDSQRK